MVQIRHRFQRATKYMNRGFTLIQTMMSLMIVTTLSMGMTKYLKANQSNLRSGDLAGEVRTSTQVVHRRLTDDFKQIAKVNPSCTGNPASGVTVTTLCTDIKVGGPIIPLPGYNKGDVTSLSNMSTISNLTAASASLTNGNDAIRVVLYDFTGSMNCRLNSAHVGANPSTTAGSALGAERMWARYTECNGKLNTNGLYILEQAFGSSPNMVVYSNLFQITALTVQGSEIQIDLQSSQSIFNQVGGMGLSGYSGTARIFPVKMVEWAVDPGPPATGLWRREIKPATGNANGYQSWVQVEDDVEGIQFDPVTINSTAVTVYHRTMAAAYGTSLSSLQTLHGLNPHFVIKARRQATDATLYSNPLVTSSTTDHYPRKEMYFYVNVSNAY